MKNKYLLLILLFSIFASAQTDSTQVVLSTNVARQVVKDIEQGDFCEKELKETQTLVTQLETKVVVVEKEKVNLETQNKLQVEISQSKDERIKILEDSLKSEKNKKLGNKILLYGSLALSLFLVINK